MPRSPTNNTLIPLFRTLSKSLGEDQARNELRWLVEHARAELSDRSVNAEREEVRESRSIKKTARIWRDQPAPSAEELIQDKKRFNPVQWAWLRQAVSDRTDKHKPLQYILGDQPFGKVNMRVKPPVLIPRWETEEWVLRLAELVRDAQSNLAELLPLQIIDACSGSGCISLALASELPAGTANIVGLDISQDAVLLADENHARNYHLLNDNRVEFHQVDMQAQTSIDKILGLSTTWHMIVSNPPYVTPSEYRGLDSDVKEWEDRRALVPMPPNADPESIDDKYLDPSGISLIVELAKAAKSLNLASYIEQMVNLPRLVVEIGGKHQTEPVRQAMHDQGFNSTEVWKDLAGQDRVVLGYVKE